MKYSVLLVSTILVIILTGGCSSEALSASMKPTENVESKLDADVQEDIKALAKGYLDNYNDVYECVNILRMRL